MGMRPPPRAGRRRGSRSADCSSRLRPLLLFAVACAVAASVPSAGAQPEHAESLSFTPPQLSDEEQEAHGTPASMRCDACVAITWNIFQRFLKAEALLPRSRENSKLYESELFEITDEVCERRVFNNYGVKTVDGRNRLSGDGLAAGDEPGMLMGGGQWPRRMGDACGNILGDLGEEEVYTTFRAAVGGVRKASDALLRFAEQVCTHPVVNMCEGKAMAESLLADPTKTDAPPPRAARSKKRKKKKKKKKKRKKKKKKRTGSEL